jgi:tripartite-type tricarboxylate transporter receptor subunit TctC
MNQETQMQPSPVRIRPITQAIAMVASVLGLVLSNGQAMAQSAAAGAWPERPIKLVLPFPPGGPSDMVARLAAEKLLASLKQPVVIENKPGAGGNLGTAEVSRATPDGYTWMLATDTVVTVNPHVYKQLGFKVEALQPVSLVTAFSQTLVCNPGVGVKTVRELVAKAKASPMSYASGGPGVPGHLSMELLLDMAGFDMNHVPYRGPAPAAQDVLGGQVPCGLLAGPTVLPHVRAGKLVALAVSGSSRSPTLPDVPTMAEAGVAGYEANFKLALFAPQGVPPAIVARFQQAFAEALSAPDVVERLKATDQIVLATSPAEAARVLAADSNKWGAVARKIKLGLD